MNLKKLMTFSITGFILLFGVMHVNAEEDPDAWQNKEFDSKATIDFTPGTGTPKIVDPTDPSEPLDPIDPDNPPTGNKGPLTLDYVSNLDFGTHEIAGSTAIYESTNLRPFIQVTDRRGTGAGWHVTARISEFKIVDTDGDTIKEETLPGAILSLSNGEAISTDKKTGLSPNTEIKLKTGGDATNIVTAAADSGLGTWVNRWLPTENDAELNNNVTLEVPAGAATLGDHTATITWTLADTPGN